MGLRSVDNIAERLSLPGVYGPLYRLFEISDQKFNIAVELTAGNRSATMLHCNKRLLTLLLAACFTS